MMRTCSSRLLPYSLGSGTVHIGEASLCRPWPCAQCLVSQNWSWAGLQRSIHGLSLGTMFISVPRLLAAVTVGLNPTGCRGFLINVTSFPRRASAAGRSLGYAGVPRLSHQHVAPCNELKPWRCPLGPQTYMSRYPIPREVGPGSSGPLGPLQGLPHLPSVQGVECLTRILGIRVFSRAWKEIPH